MTIGDNRKCVRPVAIAWLVLPLLFLANHTVAEPAEGMCAGKPAVSPGDYTYELESGGYTATTACTFHQAILLTRQRLSLWCFTVAGEPVNTYKSNRR